MDYIYANQFVSGESMGIDENRMTIAKKLGFSPVVIGTVIADVRDGDSLDTRILFDSEGLPSYTGAADRFKSAKYDNETSTVHLVLNDPLPDGFNATVSYEYSTYNYMYDYTFAKASR